MEEQKKKKNSENCFIYAFECGDGFMNTGMASPDFLENRLKPWLARTAAHMNDVDCWKRTTNKMRQLELKHKQQTANK